MKFDTSGISENMTRILKFLYNPTRITGTSEEDKSTFMVSPSILLRMRNVSGKSFRENQKAF
jgi:hypothetical protein